MFKGYRFHSIHATTLVSVGYSVGKVLSETAIVCNIRGEDACVR